MAIEWRRVTWYSQLLAVILALVIFGLGFWIGGRVEDAKTGMAPGSAMPGDMPMQGMNPGGPMMPATAGTSTQDGSPVINDVTFSCDAGKTVRAIFHQNDVQVLLSDGRNLTVPHAVSADGGRYANDDESFVFWTKGQGAFITEGAGSASKTTFANCVVAPQPN